MMNEKAKERMTIRSWMARNWLGLGGIGIGIIAIIISVYIYNSSQKKRELSYYIHPVKSIILQKDQSSNLRVLHNEKEISSDITATQIAIWNKGSESIRKENILKDVYMVTVPNVPILEIKKRSQSRDVINFLICDSLAEKGVILVSWSILEKNDYVVLELMYGGSPNVDISLQGIIEGQTEIFYIKSPVIIQTADGGILDLNEQMRISVLITMFSFIGLAVIIFVVATVLRKRIKSKKPAIVAGVILTRFLDNRVFATSIIVVLVTVIIMLLIYYFMERQSTPFGF